MLRLYVAIVFALLISVTWNIYGSSFAKGMAKRMTASETSNFREIPTRYGTLLLSEKNGEARLSGTLARSTSCVSWNIFVEETGTAESPSFSFMIFDKHKKRICVQAWGQPQNIDITLPSNPGAYYEITLENSLMFKGTLNNPLVVSPSTFQLQ